MKMCMLACNCWILSCFIYIHRYIYIYTHIFTFFSFIPIRRTPSFAAVITTTATRGRHLATSKIWIEPLPVHLRSPDGRGLRNLLFRRTYTHQAFQLCSYLYSDGFRRRVLIIHSQIYRFIDTDVFFTYSPAVSPFLIFRPSNFFSTVVTWDFCKYIHCNISSNRELRGGGGTFPAKLKHGRQELIS